MTVAAPTTVADLEESEFTATLANGLAIQMGPFAGKLRARADGLAPALYRLYRDYPLLDDDGPFSFHASLQQRSRLLRSPQVRFSVDGVVPHEDMPAAQALPVLEWGINLVIALRAHSFLMLHAAALELEGHGLLMPAAPGDGKSTLCAGLALAGWRLFSDEFGLVRPGTNVMWPVPRPVALKNASIDIIRRFDRMAHVGPTTLNTRKGDVAHLRPPAESVHRSGEPAPVRWIVFPRWVADAPTVITEIAPSEGFMVLASNAFNYELLGERGFETVKAIISGARCLGFEYSDLEEGVSALTDFLMRDDV